MQILQRTMKEISCNDEYKARNEQYFTEPSTL